MDLESGSADLDLAVGEKFVGRQRKVGRRRALPDASGRVVDRAMAGTEITVIGTLVGERNATEMRADGDQDLPFVVALLDALFVGLGIGQGRDIDLARVLDLLLGPVIDEDRLAAPE